MATQPTHQLDLLTTLSDLIRMRTVSSDHEANRQALKWFVWQLADLPLHLTEYEFNGYPSIVLTTRRTKKPTLLLSGHMDVVPASDEMFELREKSGKLYGRGVFDMKFALAGYLKLLLELGPDLKNYDLGIMITSDEESSGEFGSGELVKHGWRPKAVFVPDSASDWAMEVVAKGVFEVIFTATGTAGHASTPWASTNAITELTDFLHDLTGLFGTEPCGLPNHAHDTINVGVISGGEVTNQVPALATARVDMRYMPGRTVAAFRHEIEVFTARYPRISARFDRCGDAVQVITDSPFYIGLAEVIKEQIGVTPRPHFSHGSTDARHFSVLGIPTMATRGAGGGQHADDEWNSVKAVEEFYLILKAYVERFGRLPKTK